MPVEQFETIVRAVPLWLLRQYLQEAGGKPGVGDCLHGEGWQAEASQIEDFAIGSVRVGQVRLVLTGRPAAVDAVRRALAPKLLRGGG
jgi:hypothetical protein